MNGSRRFKKVGADVSIGPLSKLLDIERVTLGNHVLIDDFVFIMAGAGVIIGDYVYIASFASVTGGGSFEASDFSSIATGARVLTGTDDFSGTSLTNSTIPPEYRNVERSFVRIGKHAVIGANATILPGASIGDGAIIGACSVVIKDIEAWTVNAGSPARVLGERDRKRILEMERMLGDHS